MKDLALDLNTLRAAAERSTGLSDWGDPNFFEGVGILISSLKNEANLNAKGEMSLIERLYLTFRQRLMLIEDRKRWPAIAEVKIERPIIVTGNGRSGTTLLHNLLALAPGCRGVKFWEILRPSPPPEAATYATDPRIEEIDRMLADQGFKAPSTQAKHAFGADRMEECSAVLELAGVGGYWGAFANVPSYTAYRENTDFHAPYRLHRMVLQQLSWRGAQGRMVLKAAEHMFHLPELLDTYPDATIVFIHRDPARSIASLISIVAQMRGLYSDKVDIEAVKASRFGYFDIMNRLRSIRAALDRPGRFFDVHFRSVDRDPVGTIRQLYGQIGMPFTDEYRQRIEAYMAENPRHRHGEHKYSLEDFGLSFADIDRAFGPYIRDNNVQLERTSA